MELLKEFSEALGIPAKAKDNQQLSYWCKLFDNFSFSPKEFYTMTAKNLEGRDIPDLERQYIMFQQAGVLSARRLYLQLRRERLVFEVCAAPFGTGFFVSSRLSDRRREANLLHFVAMGFAVMLFAVTFWSIFGFWVALLGLGTLVAATVYLSKFAPSELKKGFDSSIPSVPVLGAIYEYFFLPETHYRQDAAQCYQQAVHNAVMQSIDEMTTLKGLKPLTGEERRPIISNLHRK